MTIRTKAQYSGLYLTSGGTLSDNTTGQITPQKLRDGFNDLFDSQNAFWPNDSSGFIGADISGVKGIDYQVSVSGVPWKEGRSFYDIENKTLAFYTNHNDVTLQIGQETYVRALNKTGTAIPNGTVVSIIGAQGNRPTIEPAIARSDYPYAHDVIGITTHEISHNEEGLVTINGTVGMNTSSFSDGSGLFLSATTSGAMTMTAPASPNHTIHLAHALNSTTNGKILVHIDRESHLSELSDINGTTPTDYSMLVYNSASGFWDASAGQWDDLRIAADSVGTGASAPEQITTIGNLRGLAFDGGTTTEQVYFNIQMPHSWKQGTNLGPHVHYTPSTTGSGTIAWFLEYSWAGINSTFSGPTTISGVATVENEQWKHKIQGFPVISGVGISGVSSMIMCRLYRNPTVDSYPSDVVLLEFDLHYMSDSFGGSRSEYIK